MRMVAGQAAVGVLVGLVVSGTVTGCSDAPQPSADGASTSELMAQVRSATLNPVTPEQVAEAFALGGDATTVQREMIEKDLVGSVVEWDVKVYNVDYADGIYRVTSQPIPIASPDAVPLLRIMAFVQAQGEADEALLRSVRTDEVIRIRGLVQDIVLRTVVTIGPAVVVSTHRASA